MAKPIVLDTFSFPTQGAALDFVRDEILNAYAMGETVSDVNHDRLLRELNDRHKDSAEKSGVGIAEFFIRRTESDGVYPVGANARGIWIRRIDGSEVDWSYHTAIKRPGVKTNLKDALRSAVNERRIAFREAAFKRGGVTCALTGAPLAEIRDADVIYRNPSWSELVEGFVATMGGWRAIETNSGFGQALIGGRISDPNALEAWLCHYGDHANPMLVRNNEGGRKGS